MSSSKKRARSSDRVSLNVGGEVFQTTISTLTANSQFFSRKFSSEWSSDAEDEIFLDRDADSFRVLLSCMRHRTALLPEGDPLLCARVLLEAQYLGVDWLLEHVKGVAYTHTRDPDDEDVSVQAIAEPHVQFDTEHGGLDQALSSGVLPARFFGPVKTGSKRVKQIIPAGDNDAVMYDNSTDDMYRAVCYALLDNERGESEIEPVISINDSFCLASELPGRDTWKMAGQGVRFEYTEVLANEDDINNHCEDGFYVKTVLPGEDSRGQRQVLMEKRVTGF